MFQEGDYIVYGWNGVCEVEKIGTCDIEGVSADRLYYTLIPKYGKNGTILSPVDNTAIIMRKVMTHDQAMELLDEIDDIELLTVTSERRREQEYKEAFSSCDPRVLVSIIKTIYARKAERAAVGKKATSSDIRYINLAENQLYGELAVSLDIERELVKTFIEDYRKAKNGDAE